MDLDISEIISPASDDKRSEHRRYLIKWKLVMSAQLNGVDRTFYGWIGEVSMDEATAYIENNLPVRIQLAAVFAIPPKIPHVAPKTIQVKCKSTYCVLNGNGMFRVGLQFASFTGNGHDELAKELADHIPLNAR